MTRAHGPVAAHPLGPALGVLGAAPALFQYAPSVVALGQWSPFRVVPGDLCRWRGDGVRKNVALTFDDGPDPEATPEVLDALDDLDLRATFFVLGERARAHPALVEEIARRGHLLATHGDVHAHHFLRTPRWIHRDLQRARDVLESMGHPPRWFRPSFGQATGATLLVARAMGLRTALWSAWGREWSSSNAAEVAERVSRGLRPGAIVLLHDSERYGPPGMAQRALDALPLIAHEMSRRALRAVTLDDLVR